MENLFHRTSVRKYLEKPVEKAKILEILRAAMAAPSACIGWKKDIFTINPAALGLGAAIVGIELGLRRRLRYF